MKKFGIAIFGILACVFSFALADDFVLTPEAKPENQGIAKDISDPNSGVSGNIWDKYNKAQSGINSDVGAQMASGIMSWNTILQYASYIVKWLSQIALVIGAVMIIYAGYLYGTSIFRGDNATKGSRAIKEAIKGVLVIIFAFAIMKIVTSMFL